MAVTAVQPQIPINDGGCAVFLVEQNVRRAEVDVDQVLAGEQVARGSGGKSEDFTDHITRPMIAAGDEFDDLARLPASRLEPLRHRWHAREAGHRVRELLVDLDNSIDSLGSEPLRWARVQPLLDKHHTIAYVHDKFVTGHRQTLGLEGVQETGHALSVGDTAMEDRHYSGATVRPLNKNGFAELACHRPTSNGQSRTGGAIDRTNKVHVFRCVTQPVARSIVQAHSTNHSETEHHQHNRTRTD